LNRYRDWCAERQFWVPYNQVRTALRSYARETQRDRDESDLYRAIRRVPSLATERKRDRQALHPWQVLDLMKRLPEREAQHVWNLCATALRPDEYSGGMWTVAQDPQHGSFVRVTGTKTDAAKRVMPLVEGVKAVRYVDSTFRRELRKAVGNALVPRDFRSTGRMWLQWAGIPDNRAKQYFGHSLRGIDDRYRTHEVMSWLRKDAESLAQYISDNSTPPSNPQG
jgi:hypothetical protein